MEESAHTEAVLIDLDADLPISPPYIGLHIQAVIIYSAHVAVHV